MRRISALAAVALAAACSGSAFPYPASLTDYFGEEKLVRAADWTRDGTSAAVYVLEGESVPAADLQVGIIVSYDYPTGDELQSWIDLQASQAEERYYFDLADGESCTIARTRDPDQPRLYMGLITCRDGTDRGICVQADERFDDGHWTSCMGTARCFKQACDAQWLKYGEEMDWLIADLLRKR